jgi:hypothetical protein
MWIFCRTKPSEKLFEEAVAVDVGGVDAIGKRHPCWVPVLFRYYDSGKWIGAQDDKPTLAILIALI